MLMGIATKNSILLVEYAIVARRGHDGSDGRPAVAAMSRFDALLDARHERPRPIVMTTLVMGTGMVPLAASWGAADNSFRSPMAVAAIGGLITSTVLSVLAIPSVLRVMDDFEKFFGRAKRRLAAREASR
jgi:multidrug efflux pump subunit AcrB